MNYLKLNDITSYKTAFNLANYIWSIVKDWSAFSRNTIGTQFVEAIDSISANIAEGFGRFGKKDKIKFYYYSLGSVKESLDWNEKAKVRKLLSSDQYSHILTELQQLSPQIHHLIKFTNLKLQQ